MNKWLEIIKKKALTKVEWFSHVEAQVGANDTEERQGSAWADTLPLRL